MLAAAVRAPAIAAAAGSGSRPAPRSLQSAQRTCHNLRAAPLRAQSEKEAARHGRRAGDEAEGAVPATADSDFAALAKQAAGLLASEFSSNEDTLYNKLQSWQVQGAGQGSGGRRCRRRRAHSGRRRRAAFLCAGRGPAAAWGSLLVMSAIDALLSLLPGWRAATMRRGRLSPGPTRQRRRAAQRRCCARRQSATACPPRWLARWALSRAGKSCKGWEGRETAGDSMGGAPAAHLTSPAPHRRSFPALQAEQPAAGGGWAGQPAGRPPGAPPAGGV